MIEVENYNDAAKIISENKVENEWLIVGGAGTGKTSKVPVALANMGYKVFVCLQNKISVYSAWNFAKNNLELNESIRNNVGVAAESKILYSNHNLTVIRNSLSNDFEELPTSDTRLVFCTNGHMRRLIRDIHNYSYQRQNSKLRSFCDFLIIDEYHTKTKDQELIIRYLASLRRSYPNLGVPVLIKMSASFFEEPNTIQYKPEPSYEKLIFYYDSKIYDRKREEEIEISEIASKRNNVENVPRVLSFFLNYMKDAYKKRGMQSNFYGTALIFLSGIGEIRYVKNEIEKRHENFSKIIGSFDILIAHSSISREDLNNLITRKIPKWRIILSTDICETSITIPDVSLVIDTMRKKSLQEGNKGTTILKTVNITKDSAEQRAGRTGRELHGIVVRLITYENYNKLQDHQISELKRLPISKEMLEVLKLNISPLQFFSDLDISKKITSNMKELAKYCCLLKRRTFYEMSSIGNFVSEIPLSIENSLIIYHSMGLRKNYYLYIIIAVSLETYQGFMSEEYEKKEYPLLTLLIPFVKCYFAFGGLYANARELYDFCAENDLRYDSFKDAIFKINGIYKYLKSNNDDELSNVISENLNFLEVYKDMLFISKKIFPRLVRNGEYYVDSSSNKFYLNKKFPSVDTDVIYALSVYNKFNKDKKENLNYVDVRIPEEFDQEFNDHFSYEVKNNDEEQEIDFRDFSEEKTGEENS